MNFHISPQLSVATAELPNRIEKELLIVLNLDVPPLWPNQEEEILFETKREDHLDALLLPPVRYKTTISSRMGRSKIGLSL